MQSRAPFHHSSFLCQVIRYCCRHVSYGQLYCSYILFACKHHFAVIHYRVHCICVFHHRCCQLLLNCWTCSSSQDWITKLEKNYANVSLVFFYTKKHKNVYTTILSQKKTTKCFVNHHLFLSLMTSLELWLRPRHNHLPFPRERLSSMRHSKVIDHQDVSFLPTIEHHVLPHDITKMVEIPLWNLCPIAKSRVKANLHWA